MLRWGFRLIVVLILVVGGLAAFAYFKPVEVSRLVWPHIENYMLQDPFVGVTTDGTPQNGLFDIRETGVDTSGIVEAANGFIDSLSAEQQSRLLFPVDDTEWRRWANIHLSTRQGVGFLEMTDAQATAALNLLAESLSPQGFDNAISIMSLEGHLADLMNHAPGYGEKRYWMTIMGTPSTDAPWGWQIDGHHLVINFFVLGDQVVMTPTFMGSEPPVAGPGPFEGIEVLQTEQNAGLAFVNTLTDAQRAVAILSDEKGTNNNYGELFSDNAVVPYEGIRLADLTNDQQKQARQLIRLYIGNMNAGHAAVKMVEVLRHWDETYFAWIGKTDDDAVFYYRFQSPVVMIEFDHQGPIALSGPNRPSRDHVHTVVRTPNGNDYGKDLLRQHLQQHAH